MADLKAAGTRAFPSPLYLEDEALKQGVDMLFFAYSDVFAQGEERLREAGLGRAHRRVLYFVSRNPGLSVTQLLTILKIKKQSLNRVLNELLAAGYVERKAGMQDRRKRQLKLTAEGVALETAIWEAQRTRLVRAFRDAGPDAVEGFRRVLRGLAGNDRPRQANGDSR